jgi:hypothetical protein
MSEVYVVCNQLGQFWGKKKRWVDGTRPARIQTLKHRDEGLNLLVELSSRDIGLRGEVLATKASERGVPQVEPSEHRIEDEDDIAARLAMEAEPAPDPEPLETPKPGA